MRRRQRWVQWIGFGGLFLGIALMAVRAGSVGDAILDLQVRIPQDPAALFGNILAIASGLFLVFLKLRGRRRAPGARSSG